MDEKITEFFYQRNEDIENMARDSQLKDLSLQWMIKADRYKYTYNFTWMGRPIIKYPNDMIVQQELMWTLKPDLIIETGVAHGGSIIFSASMMKMMGIKGSVIGIDIDIREHNLKEIEDHPMYDIIHLYEGDSTDSKIVQQVQQHVDKAKTVLVILDSLHSHQHVLKELNLYSKFVTKSSYIILPDTFIEFFPKGYYSKDRPWDVGNNPYTAMHEFLKNNSSFMIDKKLSSKAVISETIDGYLKRVS